MSPEYNKKVAKSWRLLGNITRFLQIAGESNITGLKKKENKLCRLFSDENINENYERIVFLNIRKRWPEGFLTVIADDKIVGACCGAILPNEKLRVLILVLQENYQKKGLGKELMNKMIKASNFFGVKKVTLEVRKDSEAINF